MAGGRIAGITVVLDGDATKLNAALKSVDTQIKTTQGQLKDINKLLKLDPGNTELLTQKQKYLGEALGTTRDRLKELENVKLNNLNQLNDVQLDALNREIEETKIKLRDLESQGATTSKALQGLNIAGEKMQVFGNKVSNVGKQLMPVSLALTAVGTAAVTNFAEVDKTMQLTNETMKNTEEEAAMLGKAMKEAAMNSTFGMSEAAEATLNFARAGLTAEEAAAALAPAMALAAGEGGNLTTVSAGLVGAINGFGDSFDNTAHYADVLANACNNSALDIDSLANSIGTAVPIFATAGYSIEDVALALGVMADKNISADVAANSLKTGLARLVSPAKQGAEAMDRLGISVTNTDGSMKSFTEIQQILHDKFSQLSESEQMAAASAIFGKNQMSSWLALINTAPEDVEALNSKLRETGTAMEMSDAMMEGFGGSIERLKSTLDVAAATLGEALAPTIQKVANFISKLLEMFVKLDPKTQQFIARIGLIVAAAGPLLLIGGKLISAFGTLLTNIPKLITQISKIPGAISPVGIAVAALAAAFIYLWKNNEEFRNRITEIWNGLKEKISGFCQGIVERVNALGFEFSSVFEIIKAVWNDFCSVLAPVIEGAFSAISTIVSTALDLILYAFDLFIAIFNGDWSGAWEAIKNIFITVWNGIVGIFKAVWETIKGIFDTVFGSLGGRWSETWESIKNIFVTVWNTIVSVAETIWNGLSEFFSGLWSGIKALTEGDWSTISEFLSSTWETIKSTAETVWNTIKEFLTGLWEDVSTTATEAWTNISSFLSETWNSISSIATSVWGGIKDFFSGLWDDITSGAEKAWGAISGFFSGAWNGIKGTASNVWNGVSGFFSDTWGSMQDTSAGVWGAISSDTTAVWGSIDDFFRSTWADISASAESGSGDVSETVSSKMEALKTTFTETFEGLKQTFTDAWSGISESTATTITDISTTVTTEFTNLQTTTTTIWTDITTYLTTTWTTIQTEATTVWTGIGTFLSTLWTDFQATTTTVWTTISTLLLTTWTTIQTTAITVWTAIQTFYTTFWLNMTTLTTTSMTTISTTMNESWTLIIEFVTAQLTALLEITTTTFNQITALITTGMAQIVATIKTAANQITATIRTLVNSAYGWGADFVGGFQAGILSRMYALLATVRSMAAQIASYLHFSEPDRGPLSNYHTWMPDFMKGLADDINRNKYLVEDAISKVAGNMTIHPQLALAQVAGGYGGGAKNTMSHTGTIRVQGVNDREQVAAIVDIVIDQLRQEVRT